MDRVIDEIVNSGYGQRPNEGAITIHKRFAKKLQETWNTSEQEFLRALTGKDVTNLDRINHVLNILDYDNIQFKENIVSRYEKSTILATSLRENGNVAYKNGDFGKALNLYSKSLLFALLDSQDLALAFANRSAIFFTTKKYSDCLLDISRALESGYPAEKSQKLLERKLNCEKEIQKLQKRFNSGKDILDLDDLGKSIGMDLESDETKLRTDFCHQMFKLSNSNPVIPSAQNFVTIQNSVERGRHVVTTESVSPGTVLIVDEPYSKIMLDELKWNVERCHHCHMLTSTGIPCQFCSFAFYCTKSCRDTASQGYHKFECACAPYFHHLAFTRIFLLALRTITTLGTQGILDLYNASKPASSKNISSEILTHLRDSTIKSEMPSVGAQNSDTLNVQTQSSVSMLPAKISENPTLGPQNSQVTILREQFENSVLQTQNSEVLTPMPEDSGILGSENGIYHSKSYAAIHHLISHPEKCGGHELLSYAITSISLVQVLDKYSSFFNLPECDLDERLKVKSFTASLILLHILNLPCNAHSLYSLNADKNDSDWIRTAISQEYGAGAYSLLSLINHSCDPNVVRVNNAKGQVAVITLKGLSPGTEILDNYGHHFAIEDSTSRRKELLSNYYFDCACTPCTEEWPQLMNLKELPPKFICAKCDGAEGKGHDTKTHEKEIKHDRVLEPFGDSLICKSCKSQYLGSKVTEELDMEIDGIFVAHEMVLKNQALEAIPRLIKSLSYFSSHIQLPFIRVNDTEETYKQALNLITKSWKPLN